ncbi:MAG: transposase [Actinobacteria bacterium]|nr:transposase [Actinomycetota bacterium]
MSRPLRIEFPGAIYHITSRGNAKQEIFETDEDRAAFLRTLQSVTERYKWLCHAYCLMNNHYHLLVETPDCNLSVGMRQLNGVYTQAWNRMNGSSGHLFEGRFKSIVVDKDNYFLEVSRYIVLNPVRAGLVDDPSRWRWSSYRATSGLVKAPSFLSVKSLLSLFSNDEGQARRRYSEFVLAGSECSIWEHLRGTILLGDDDFIEGMNDYLSGSAGVREVPSEQKFVSRATLPSLFGAGCTTAERDEGIWSAHVNHGYSLREIGDHLGIHYSTISRALNRQLNNSRFKT